MGKTEVMKQRTAITSNKKKTKGVLAFAYFYEDRAEPITRRAGTRNNETDSFYVLGSLNMRFIRDNCSVVGTAHITPSSNIGWVNRVHQPETMYCENAKAGVKPN